MKSNSLILYVREGCHLCEDAEALVRRLGYDVTPIDVDQDPSLQARYGEQVPVLVVGGRDALAGIFREGAVREALAAYGASETTPPPET
jgi:glutaredoxin